MSETETEEVWPWLSAWQVQLLIAFGRTDVPAFPKPGRWALDFREFDAAMRHAGAVLSRKAAEGAIVGYTDRGVALTPFDWTPSGPSGHEWSSLRFMRDAAFKVWPPKTGVAGRGGASAGGPSVLQAAAAVRPRPTDQAVRDWMRRRVAAWPNDTPAPSEAEDWSAVSRHFGDGIRRTDFRPIREQETPDEWRKRGPRRAWGMVRISAEDSAKPPPPNSVAD